MTVDTLFPLTTAGLPTNFDNATPVNLGGEIEFTATVWVTHLIRWRGTTNDSGTHTGKIFRASDMTPVAGTDVTWTDAGTGWQEAGVTPPVQLPPSVRYVVAERCPNGGPAYEQNYFTTGPGASGRTSANGLITAPSSAASTRGNGIYNNAGTLTCPDLTYQGNNYYMNLRVTDVDPNTAPTAAGSATSSATAAGTRTAVAQAAASGAGGAAADATRTAVAAAAASATGAGTADGVRIAVAAASASSASSATAAAERIPTGTATATGTGTAAAAGSRTAVASAAASAAGTAYVADDTPPTAHGTATGTAAAALHPIIRRPRRGTIHRP